MKGQYHYSVLWNLQDMWDTKSLEDFGSQQIWMRQLSAEEWMTIVVDSGATRSPQRKWWTPGYISNTEMNIYY